MTGLLATFGTLVGMGGDPGQLDLADRWISRLSGYNANHSEAKTKAVVETVLGFEFAAQPLADSVRRQRAAALVDALEAIGFKPYEDSTPDDEGYMPAQITGDRQQAVYKILGMAMTQLRDKGRIAGNIGVSLRVISEQPFAPTPEDPAPGC